jgi:hypothetical protein
MVSLNSRVGLRRALGPGPGSSSESYSFPQFAVSHIPGITTQRTAQTSSRAELEELDRENKGKVRINYACEFECDG